jgi:hypothetical protein
MIVPFCWFRTGSSGLVFTAVCDWCGLSALDTRRHVKADHSQATVEPSSKLYPGQNVSLRPSFAPDGPGKLIRNLYVDGFFDNA